MARLNLPETFTVDANNLYNIFRCLLGPQHMILELMAIRDLDDSPIKKLGEELKVQLLEANKKSS